MHDRRAAEVGDAMFADQVEDHCGVDLPKADAGSGHSRERPGKHHPLRWNIRRSRDAGAVAFPDHVVAERRDVAPR